MPAQPQGDLAIPGFEAETRAAAKLFADPARPTGLERFQVAYSRDPRGSSQTIGNLLFLASAQRAVIDHYCDDASLRPDEHGNPPKNDLPVSVALKAVALRMKAAAAKLPPAERADYLRAVDAYFQVFDVRGSRQGFSGLPFFSLVKHLFNDRRFETEVTALHGELLKVVGALRANPRAIVEPDLFQLATRATGGDRERAIQLLGVLLSRDVLGTRYLKHIRAPSRDFARAFGMTPLLVRLIAELDQRNRGSSVDRFSVPEGAAFSSPKSYYFWSAALASSLLRKMNLRPDHIEKVAGDFPRQYKALRFLEQRGPLRGRSWRREFQKDTDLVSGISSEGSRLATLAQASPASGASPRPRRADAVSAFLDASSERPGLASLLVKDLVSEMARSRPGPKLFREGAGPSTSRASATEGGGKVYVLYYDYSRSRIGLSHLKLVVDGRAYEIHREPNADGSFLRNRDLLTSLRDARPGRLPTSIAEIPATAEQKKALLAHLEASTGRQMKYAIVNRLGSPDARNCAGVIYDALQAAGLVDQPLARTDLLAGQVYGHILRSARPSRVAGRRVTALGGISHANLSKSTLKGPSYRTPAAFERDFGHEYLVAEQQLSERTPLLSNLRRAAGVFRREFSNTGDLPAVYRPASGQTFGLKVLLIPLADLPLVRQASSLSEKAQRDLFVDHNGVRCVRFFIHPDSVANYQKLIERYPEDPTKWIATPSSSARSLLVRRGDGTGEPFMIKTSLFRTMAGYKRSIDKERVVRAVAMSDAIKEAWTASGGRLGSTGKRWDFMAEPFAVLPPGLDGQGGFIYRDVRPITESRDIMIPWYSLVANRPAGERWIDELYRYSGYKSKAEFAWKELAKPLASLHATLALEHGITTELHQQNVLLRIDPATRRVKGLVVRDMDGNWVDHSLRVHALGKPPVRASRSFAEDNSVLLFGRAQENMTLSYEDTIRTRALQSVLKCFLPRKELARVIWKVDDLFVEKFNRTFPSSRIRGIEELATAMRAVHDACTTPTERRVYDKRRAEWKAQRLARPSVIRELGQKIERRLRVPARRPLSSARPSPGAKPNSVPARLAARAR